MNILLFSISTIAPTFIVILLGSLLRKWNILTQELAGGFSKTVFFLLLPALIVKTLATMDKNTIFTMAILMAILFFYFVTILLAWFISLILKFPRDSRGYFMTGASFGNNAIIGYAFGAALFGNEGIGRAALLSAILMPISILVSGILLTPRDNKKTSTEALKDFSLSLIKNPVMISLVLGIGLWKSPFILSGSILDTLSILAEAALPVALLAVGGSLEFNMRAQDLLEIAWTSILKLLFMPLLALGAGLYLKLSPGMTGSLLLMAACPSSISYYVMGRNLGHSPAKGAAVVTVTTISSAFSAAAITAFLKLKGWI